MSIKTADNFKYNGRKPLDDRTLYDTIADMASMTDSMVSDGLIAYNKETKKYYSFKTNNLIDPILGKWEELKIGTSSSSAVDEYKQGVNITENTLILYNKKLYVAASNFTANDTEQTLNDSLQKDLDNGNLIPINAKNDDNHSFQYTIGEEYKKGNLLVKDEKLYITNKNFTAIDFDTEILNKDILPVNVDTDTNCIEYKQSKKYKSTDLIRYNNKLYFANTDFISDTTEINTDASFKLDLQIKNLIPVNEEQNYQILPYTQSTDYKKDTLVYLDNFIARVANNFTSDGVETNILDSFKKDQSIGDLILISSNSTTVVKMYESNVDYIKDTLVYCNDKIARVEKDFKSSVLSLDSFECFEDDIKIGNLNLINTDHASIMNEYNQGNMYFKNTLVFKDGLIARTINDFISDNDVLNAIEDSWDVDVTLGNIIVLNKEAEPGIKPYKQNTLFTKDKLVFADGRIGRVLNDYISDNTGITLEESINIDIANGNLREMGENYKFKLYKTTQDMNKEIDSINVLPISTIVFENGENINNMKLNEAVYGPLGTLALITDIDVNLNQIKTKTVNSREMEFMPPAPNTYTYTIILPGTGFSIGEIVATSLPGVNVEIDSVGSNGEIINVIPTLETITNANGVGASIDAELILYLGNGKQWYESPQNKGNAVVKEYAQGQLYEKDNLIYLGDVLARALTDFISDSSMTTLEDSFNFDKDTGNIVRMTREDVSVPEYLGSVKTDSLADLPSIAIKGNWVLIENCTNFAPGQAGIGSYNGSSWDINPIPQGTFSFSEPNEDGKLYFRKREIGNTNGQWEAFSSIDGDNIDIILKEKSDLIDNTYIPKKNELVWDYNRNILVRGDGVTTLGSLKEFYGKNIDSSDILSAIGYTPENASEKGQANGYAPLDANGLVPVGNLPSSLTDTYSKTEIDNKNTAILNSATTLVNTESTRAKNIENGLRHDLDSHINDTVKHVTQTEKDIWNAKVDASDLTSYDNHISDTVIHVTQNDKDRWDGMNKVYYVMSASDLPTTGNRVGNIGYVQISASGVTPVVCDQYIWDGNKWNQQDVNQVTLQLNWGNIQGKPSSTPLSIDNTVTVAHNHTNKTVLDKIGQSASGAFTYNGIEIGVRVVFLSNENLLPITGEDDTLYVIYEDSRVRNYPSISVWRDGSYQILGRGTQDTPPVVGDMSILQTEYFSVVKNSKYTITVSPNQYFAFMPVEILKEIEGLKDQQKEIIDFNDPSMFYYNEDILTINPSSKLSISIREKEATLDTVSNFYYSHVDIDLSDYKDIDNIG